MKTLLCSFVCVCSPLISFLHIRQHCILNRNYSEGGRKKVVVFFPFSVRECIFYCDFPVLRKEMHVGGGEMRENKRGG